MRQTVRFIFVSLEDLINNFILRFEKFNQLKPFLFILTMFAGTVSTAQNLMQPKKETVDALQKIAFLTGNWKGSGYIQMGPQKHSFNESETITLKLNGTIIQIEGEGKDQQNPELTIHQAFAIISYNIQNAKYVMKAFRGDGEQVDADTKLIAENSFQWSFSNPMAGQIKFTITVSGKIWTEIGEISRDDGKNWNKYFEMTLIKQ